MGAWAIGVGGASDLSPSSPSIAASSVLYTCELFLPPIGTLLLFLDVFEIVFESFLLDAQILLNLADFFESFGVSLSAKDLVERLLHRFVFTKKA